MRYAKNWPWESSPYKGDDEEMGKSMKKDGVQEIEEISLGNAKIYTRNNFHVFKFPAGKKKSYWNSESLFHYTGKIILSYVAPVFTKVPNQYQKN